MNIRVLMFGWEFPPHNSGGLGTACRGLCKSLVSENVDLTFVLPRHIDIDDDWLHVLFAGVANIRVKAVNSLLTPYATASEYSKRRLYFRGGIYAEDLYSEVVRYADKVEALIKDDTFDVIHAHEWLSFLAGMRAKELTGKPLILHVHSTEYDRSGGSMNPEVFDIEKEAFEKADKILAVSNYTKGIIVDKYGVNPDLIEVVYNGVEVPQYFEKPNDYPKPRLLHLKKHGYKIVLYVGRFSMHKGPDYFVKAAKKVLGYRDDVIFVMAGSGEMEHELIEMVAELGISDHVLFAGYLRGEELDAMFSSADLYVLPSVSEPFGIAPLESLIRNTPVLISKQSGVSEIVSHALKVDFWDTDEMTNKIITALDHPEMLKELQSNGRKQALLLNWKAAAKKVVNIYKQLVGRN
jgi:glycosyltransferase involved in cell wall biosynthesis